MVLKWVIIHLTGSAYVTTCRWWQGSMVGTPVRKLELCPSNTIAGALGVTIVWKLPGLYFEQVWQKSQTSWTCHSREMTSLFRKFLKGRFNNLEEVEEILQWSGDSAKNGMQAIEVGESMLLTACDGETSFRYCSWKRSGQLDEWFIQICIPLLWKKTL